MPEPHLASDKVDSFGEGILGVKPTFMYKIQVGEGGKGFPLLGQVVDLIEITKAGFKSD